MPVSFVDYSQLKYVWRPLTGSRSSLSLGKIDVLDVKAHFAGAKHIIYTYSYKNCTLFLFGRYDFLFAQISGRWESDDLLGRKFIILHLLLEQTETFQNILASRKKESMAILLICSNKSAL